MSSPLEEFNARGSRPADVARTFVMPLSQFETLLTADHHQLIGPRGSGKTTLLKMLTLDALRNWKHPDAEKYSKAIRYNSVFIQTDRAWANQLKVGSDRARIDIGDIAFCLHTLIRLISSMKSATVPDANPAIQHLLADFSQDKEIAFSDLVSKTLVLDVVIPSFLGLISALRAHLTQLLDPNLAAKLQTIYTSANLMALVALLINAFNELAGTPHRRWALLFDELEIAPTKITQYLVDVTRGTDNLIILKLALAPYHSDLDTSGKPTAPMEGHDFETVRLSYPNKQEALDFTSDMTKQIFAARGITFSRFEEIFTTRETRSPGGIPDVFHKLAQKDASFRDYAAKRKLFEKDYANAENERASDIRKILPIVQFREFYLKSYNVEIQKNSTTQRPRKSIAPYAGTPSILELTEGNPRIILTLMVPLARELAIARESNKGAKLEVPEQTKAIERAVHVLESLARAMPLGQSSTSSKRGLLELLSTIGEYFAEHLLHHSFDPDYIGTFRIDRKVSPAFYDVIGSALNAGAIIYIPSDDDRDTPHSVANGRFRLSYLLAPLYSLPLTLGRPAALSTILKGTALKQSEPDLFGVGQNEN